MNETEVRQYFKRIGLEKPEHIVPDAALLKKLVYHQIISIPYENTQFLTGKTVPCEPEALFRNIVVERKGGICHDIATLFGCFLTELGYKVRPFGTVSFSEELKSHIHRTLVVTDCEGNEWLTEIAFTIFVNLKEPLRLVPGSDQVCGGEVYRFEKRDNKMCLLAPKEKACYIMEYPDLPLEIGNWVKEETLLGHDPVGKIARRFSVGTAEGRRTLVDNGYREYFDGTLYSLDLTPETLPWAYAQFGLDYEQ